MNHEAAKAVDFNYPDLWEYFGLGKGGTSYFLQHRDLTPDTLAKSPNWKLHEQRLHKGGHYVHLDNGKPALRKEVLAKLDGLPHRMMQEAYRYLQSVDREAWNTMELMQRRFRFERVDSYAERMNISRQTIYKRLYRALEVIASYVDRELEKLVASPETQSASGPEARDKTGDKRGDKRSDKNGDKPVIIL
jgi:hypothetical protein